MKRPDSIGASETRCQVLGDLVARVAEGRQPEHRQWLALEQALSEQPERRRRLRWVLPIPALVAMGLVLWIAAGRTLGFQVQDCSLAPDGSLSVADNREGIVAFEDGTRITLGKSSRGQVHAFGFWRGAQLALQSGHMDLSVVHRLGGRWEVLAGPFQVRVSGTRFGVDWTPRRHQFSLSVSQGEVSVSGGPLPTRTPVRAGQKLDVDTATARVIVGDLGTANGMPATARAGRAAPAELPEETSATAGAAPAPADRFQRKRDRPNGKAVIQDSPSVGQAKMPADQARTPVAPASDVWSATEAAEDEKPPAPPGPRRLTVDAHGALAGGATGQVWAAGGAETWFSTPASDQPDHLYLDNGMLCTRGTIYALTCVNEKLPSIRCDWGANWGVALNWYPRPDRKAWGSGAASGIALEFQGKRGQYRLVAHREGDPTAKAYCIENYRSGQTVTPSQFKFDCRNYGGRSLSDFTQIDSFAIQLSSEETLRTFRYCLSAINLQ